MTAYEYNQWKVFYKVSPSLFDRLDWLFATVCQYLAEPNRDPSKKNDPFEATDFLMPWGMNQQEYEEWCEVKKVIKAQSKLERAKEAGKSFVRWLGGKRKSKRNDNGS